MQPQTTPDFSQSETNTQKANQWRKENGYTQKGGVIVLFNGKVQGWVNELRDPQSWQPGCIAVDESGRKWLAAGGDSYTGAKIWKPAEQETSKPHSKPGQEIHYPTLVNKNLIDQAKRNTLQKELKLIQICKEIGHIANSDKGYTLSLTLQINKPVDTLTVAQLLAFHRECSKRFNEGV